MSYWADLRWCGGRSRNRGRRNRRGIRDRGVVRVVRVRGLDVGVRLYPLARGDVAPTTGRAVPAPRARGLRGCAHPTLKTAVVAWAGGGGGAVTVSARGDGWTKGVTPSLSSRAAPEVFATVAVR